MVDARFPCVKHEDDRVDEWHWANFVRSKLVPFHYVTPVGADLQEWSREYRDMLFEMAEFLQSREAVVSRDLAREFLIDSHSPGLGDFSLEDIQMLLTKVREYRLAAVT